MSALTELVFPMSEAECLETIAEGDYGAFDLADAADPGLEAAFKRVDKAIIKLLKRARQHFPDAQFYTGSGGFNLLLGSSHDAKGEKGQQELVAFSGDAQINDGDF